MLVPKVRGCAPRLRLAKLSLLALPLSLIGRSSLKRGCRSDGGVVARETRPTIHWHGQRSLRLRTRLGQPWSRCECIVRSEGNERIQCICIVRRPRAALHFGAVYRHSRDDGPTERDQDNRAIGAEWLVVASVAAVVNVGGYVQAVRTRGNHAAIRVNRVVFGTVCCVAEMTGAVLLIAGQNMGLYVAAVGMVVYIAFMITGAWLLIIWTQDDLS